MPKPIPPADVPITTEQRLCAQDWYDFFREAFAIIAAPVTLTYGTTINTNAALGDDFILTITDGVNFTIAAPTNPAAGREINYTFRNTSGGGVGTVTWDSVFKLPSVPANWSPPTGFSRSINFIYDGTNWVQRYSSEFDVPN